MAALFERHIVLVSPEIHWNTGNIGRTCLGANAHLHLIKPLGFSLDDRNVKRAGLDYWEKIQLHVWDNFSDMVKEKNINYAEMLIFSKIGKHSIWEMPDKERIFLIFGSETRGLPSEFMKTYRQSPTFHIPITEEIRSLNLSTAVGIALYESLRKAPDFHHWS